MSLPQDRRLLSVFDGETGLEIGHISRRHTFDRAPSRMENIRLYIHQHQESGILPSMAVRLLLRDRYSLPT